MTAQPSCAVKLAAAEPHSAGVVPARPVGGDRVVQESDVS